MKESWQWEMHVIEMTAHVNKLVNQSFRTDFISFLLMLPCPLDKVENMYPRPAHKTYTAPEVPVKMGALVQASK